MRKPKTKLPVNWRYIIFTVAISATTLGFVAWNVTAQFDREWSHGLFNRRGWNAASVVALDSGCLATLLALLGKLVRDANTVIGEAELYQPRLLGRPRTIRWSEVKSVRRVGFGIHVLSKDEKIVLTPYAYLNPDTVMANVRSRIEHAHRHADSAT